MLDTIKKYPKLALLALVMMLMGLTNFLTYSLQGDIIEIRKEEVIELKEEIKTHKATLEMQISENRKLKSQLSESFEETVKPDGTRITKKTKDLSKEEDTVREQKIRLEYQYQVRELKQEIKRIENEKHQTKRSLSVGARYTTGLSSFVSFQYDMWGPFGVTGYFETLTGEVALGIGARF